jgi:hypothetical protein
MLLRPDERGVLAIGQPSHAWVSGQFARGWGNGQFDSPKPWEEVCLAAEQHDVGMARWDLEPTFNSDTGLPHSFLEMPIETHLELWSDGPRQLIRQSRYAAVLGSMHGVRLYELRDLDALPAAQADAVRTFMDEQRRFQQQLLTTLGADPATAAAATPAVIGRNSQLIWTWDFLSLVVCLDWAPSTARAVPTTSERDAVDVRLAQGADHGALIVDPWPFSSPTLTVRCEGQRLNARYESADELSRAFASAPWETLTVTLAPAG